METKAVYTSQQSGNFVITIAGFTAFVVAVLIEHFHLFSGKDYLFPFYNQAIPFWGWSGFFLAMWSIAAESIPKLREELGLTFHKNLKNVLPLGVNIFLQASIVALPATLFVKITTMGMVSGSVLNQLRPLVVVATLIFFYIIAQKESSLSEGILAILIIMSAAATAFFVGLPILTVSIVEGYWVMGIIALMALVVCLIIIVALTSLASRGDLAG